MKFEGIRRRLVLLHRGPAEGKRRASRVLPGVRERYNSKEVTMRLVKIRGRLPLQRSTGSKYRISVLLDFESRSEMETVYRKAGLPLGTGARVLSAIYLDLDDNLMQETFVTLQGRHADGRKFEVEVPTTRRWKGAMEAARAYLESKKTIYGY